MNDDKKVKLKLSDRPEGYGFFYGTASLGDELVNVSVMPPKAPIKNATIQTT